MRDADRTPPDLPRINRKRERKGKRQLDPLKSYYWIDVKPTEADKTNRTNEVSIDYREWVRGHFQRYHTASGVVKNWVQAYVRGPMDAPWKENRYRVLSDMQSRGSSLEV